MDMVVEPEVREQIERTPRRIRHATVHFDHVNTRRAGQRRFVDLHMHMPSAWIAGAARRRCAPR